MDYATGVLFKAHYTELLRQAQEERLAHAAAHSSTAEPARKQRRRSRLFAHHAPTT